MPHASATELFQQYLTNYGFKNKPVEIASLRAYISVEELSYTELVDHLDKEYKKLLLKSIFRYQYFNFLAKEPVIPFTSNNFCFKVKRYLEEFGIDSTIEGNKLTVTAENKKKWMDAIV